MKRPVLTLAEAAERINRLRRPKPSRLGPSGFVARGLIVRAMRQAGLHHALSNIPCSIGIVGVDEGSFDAFSSAARDILGAWLVGSLGYDVSIYDRTGARKQKDGLRALLLEAAKGGDRAAFFFGAPDEVSDVFHASAEGVVVLDRPDRRIVRGAFMSIAKRAPDGAGLDLVASLPLSLLDSVIVPGRSVERSLAVARQLLAAVEVATESTDIAPAVTVQAAGGGLRLEDLSGLGEAAAWGLELVSDLADYRGGSIPWASVDKGIVVSGPPGVGKTLFGLALGRSCAVPVHAHSLGLWQSKGHLGDLLKAMTAAFDEARRTAPCILLIDEIDAIGSRTDPGDRYAAYTRQVIDAMLELLDGAKPREGVVVVGLTNHVDLVDPALLRPGRLERVLTLSPPDKAARASIIRHHLGNALAETDLRPFAGRLEGATGADIELLVRDARRRARRADRGLLPEDLATGLPTPVVLSPRLLRRAAVHEAGHLVVGKLLAAVSGCTPVSASVRAVSYGNGAAGETVFSRDPAFDTTKTSLLAEIVTLLAGTAAEEAIIGDRGVGAGGSAASDLGKATEIARRIEHAFGLGSRLSVGFPPPGENKSHFPGEAVSDAAVEATLALCMAEARRLAASDSNRIRRTAERLVEEAVGRAPVAPERGHDPEGRGCPSAGRGRTQGIRPPRSP